MNFRKYMHVEKFGNEAVEGIEFGEVAVMPKIDGSNGSVWLHNDWIYAGSRNRVLTLENDNQGFYAYILDDERINGFLKKYPQYRLFGEWLKPHSLKTYRDDAWGKFYIFDVSIDKDDDDVEYIPYERYQPLLEEFGLDYIPPIAIIKNGTYEQFIHQLNNNVFLIKDGAGVGEGITIKNYDFYNKFGRQIWAKIVTSEFKEKHHKEMGAPEVNGKVMAEERIVEKYVTEALIKKVYFKIINNEGHWRSQYIPRLLSSVYHDVITEELWDALKKLKITEINFKTLQHLTNQKIKQVLPEVF